jgi:quinol monooxygenase YgiN
MTVGFAVLTCVAIAAAGRRPLPSQKRDAVRERTSCRRVVGARVAAHVTGEVPIVSSEGRAGGQRPNLAANRRGGELQSEASSIPKLARGEKMSDSNEVVVVASMKVRPDSRDQVRAALMRQVVRVHAEEPGAQLFAAHETPDGFVLIEKWHTAASLKAHAAGGAIAEYRSVLEPALVEPWQIQTMSALPAGDPTKGAL